MASAAPPMWLKASLTALTIASTFSFVISACLSVTLLPPCSDSDMLVGVSPSTARTVVWVGDIVTATTGCWSNSLTLDLMLFSWRLLVDRHFIRLLSESCLKILLGKSLLYWMTSWSTHGLLKVLGIGKDCSFSFPPIISWLYWVWNSSAMVVATSSSPGYCDTSPLYVIGQLVILIHTTLLHQS